MNLAIRGISGNLGEKAANTFLDDQHKDLKADYIMANPPFNQKDWRAENELVDDPRWRGYDVPPKSNANYGWILNMVSKLSENGVAGFILANGALSGGGEEYKIRRKLIENNLVEAILVLPRNLFYTTDISVTLWIVNKNKKAQEKKVGDETRKYRKREKEILFMDLRQMGEPFEKNIHSSLMPIFKKLRAPIINGRRKRLKIFQSFVIRLLLKRLRRKTSLWSRAST
jgi:type I restriction enzyme M protein